MTAGKFAVGAAAYLLLMAISVLAPHVTKAAAVFCGAALISAACLILLLLVYLEARNANR